MQKQVYLISFILSLYSFAAFSMNYQDRYWTRADLPALALAASAEPANKNVESSGKKKRSEEDRQKLLAAHLKAALPAAKPASRNPDPLIAGQFEAAKKASIGYAFAHLPKNAQQNPYAIALKSNAIAEKLPAAIQENILAFADSSSTFYNLLIKKEKRHMLVCALDRTPGLVPTASLIKRANDELSFFYARYKDLEAFFREIRIAEQKRHADGQIDKESLEDRNAYESALESLRNSHSLSRAAAGAPRYKKPFIIGICGVWSFQDEESQLRLHKGVYNRVDDLDTYLARAYPDRQLNRCRDNEFICVQYSNGKKEWILNKKNVGAFRSEFKRLWQYAKTLSGRAFFSEEDLAALPEFVQARIISNAKKEYQRQDFEGRFLTALAGFATGTVPGLAVLSVPYVALNSWWNLPSYSDRQRTGTDALMCGNAEVARARKRKSDNLSGGLAAFGGGLVTGLAVKTSVLVAGSTTN